MYQLLVYLHVVGVFGFLLAHGASAGVAFKLRGERNPDRIRALLDLSVWSYLVMWVGLLVLVITGIISGFLGSHWSRGWIWASIVLLVAIFVIMGLYGSRYYGRVRSAVGLKPYRRTDQVTLGEVQSEDDIATLLNTNHPLILALIGFGGLLVILWLMMFKPF